jgi:hypothetical protein
MKGKIKKNIPKELKTGGNNYLVRKPKIIF